MGESHWLCAMCFDVVYGSAGALMVVKLPVSEALEVGKVCCVFVLFYPKRFFLETLVPLSEHGYTLVVVSNGADDDLLKQILMVKNVQLIENMSNMGLAIALNQGIEKAFLDPYVNYVALFDQDSKPEKDLPRALAAEINSASIACVGPKLIDVKSTHASYKSHNSAAGGSGVFSIPTSGKVISRAAFQLVGPMMDALFIDGIDHEWCLRAGAKGLKVKISKEISMLHDMGDSDFNWFGEYKPLYKNPVRHFYIVRNAIYLGLYGRFPLGWRFVELLKTLRRIPVYFWISNDRVRSFKLMSQAIADGAIGRLGPLARGASE